MTRSRKARESAPSLVAIPQTREEVAAAIARAGELIRLIDARRADADAVVQAEGERCLRDCAQWAAELADKRRGIQTWCEAHRAEITGGGKVKFAAFGSGRVAWRTRPPRVVIRGVEAVIESCQRLGLDRFLRARVEIDKQAMLADPEAARAVAGVSIGSEGEDFVIEPEGVEVGS